MNRQDIQILSEKYTTILETTEDGGPYIHINSRGDKRYYKDRKMRILHREDGPAIENVDGSKGWFFNGIRHREDGPAIEAIDGSKLWYFKGKLHREDGPAAEYANGSKDWWLKGKHFTEEEFDVYSANKRYSKNMKDIGEEPVEDFSAFD